MLEKQAEDFRKMRSGDMKAFERLFVSLYPGLCNIANHYLIFSCDLLDCTGISRFTAGRNAP